MTRARIAAYGLGDFGFNLGFTGLNLFLLFYYSNVLELGPELAGLMVMGPVIWDAVTDPLMGWIASRLPHRARFPRGRYRPAVLFGAPLLGVSFALMFTAPLLFPGTVVASAVIAHLVFRTAYTIANVPYSALMAALTQDGRTRAGLATSRMVGAIFGGVTAAGLTLPLANALGEGNLASGFAGVGIVYGIIAAALLMVVFASTTEAVETRAPAKLTFGETVRFLKSNSAFWILFAAIFIYAGTSAVGSNALVFYIESVLGTADAAAPILFATLLIAGLAVPVWGLLAARWGSKRKVWAGVGVAVGIVGLGQAILAPSTFATLLGSQLFIGALGGAIPVLFWSMVPDTVEWGEWRSGIRDEAIGFGLVQLALKGAAGVGIGVLGWALATAGYQQGVAATGGTVDAVRWFAFGVPAIGALITSLVILRYPFDDREHADIVDSLRARVAT